MSFYQLNLTLNECFLGTAWYFYVVCEVSNFALQYFVFQTLYLPIVMFEQLCI